MNNNQNWIPQVTILPDGHTKNGFRCQKCLTWVASDNPLNCVCNPDAEENFTHQQIIKTIKDYLQFAEDCKDYPGSGYYHGHGFSARCLRFYLNYERNSYISFANYHIKG